mmetsp:Transcript_17940/g.67646  ORF Transcript_17940/g.67646 Transcript_17940/m.67646 type:complete len:342 (+) Transcript_17940:6042-7067(+)
MTTPRARAPRPRRCALTPRWRLPPRLAPKTRSASGPWRRWAAPGGTGRSGRTFARSHIFAFRPARSPSWTKRSEPRSRPTAAATPARSGSTRGRPCRARTPARPTLRAPSACWRSSPASSTTGPTQASRSVWTAGASSRWASKTLTPGAAPSTRLGSTSAACSATPSPRPLTTPSTRRRSACSCPRPRLPRRMAAWACSCPTPPPPPGPPCSSMRRWGSSWGSPFGPRSPRTSSSLPTRGSACWAASRGSWTSAWWTPASPGLSTGCWSRSRRRTAGRTTPFRSSSGGCRSPCAARTDFLWRSRSRVRGRCLRRLPLQCPDSSPPRSARCWSTHATPSRRG